MKFCMHCGHQLEKKWLVAESAERSVCSACGRVHYENPKLLVWCFAHWQDRILLCRRAHEPARGLWNPPAGFVEAGETLEEAVAREVFEEAGLRIAPSKFILYRVSSIPHMNEVYVGFRTALESFPQLAAGVEVSEIGLYGAGAAPLRELAYRDMIGDVPEDFFRCLQSGDFPVFAETIRLKAAQPR